MRQQRIISWLVCDMRQKVDFIQLAKISSVVRPRSSKALSKAKLAPKKRSWPLFGDLLPAFLNPRKTIAFEKYAQQLNEIHWKRQHLQPAPVNATAADRKSHKQHFKADKELGYEVLPHPSRSPDLLSTNYYFFKHLNNFLQVKCFHNQQMLSQSSLNPATDFYTTVINLFLLGKNTLIVMVPTLMNKDVFEPSYNDLKFMVRNCN